MDLPIFNNPPGPPPTAVQLAAIEELAANGFTKVEVCEITGLDVFWFGSDNSDAHKAYRKGFLKSELEVRQSIFRDAKNGSSPAQAMAKKILDEANYKAERE